jgi:NAD(P)H-flavin reductase
MAILNKTTATIRSINQECHDTKSFTLNLKDKFSFQPGQFVILTLPYHGRVVRRSYSLSSPPNQDTAEICLNYVKGGAASEFFFNAKTGQTIELDGPYGLFTLQDTNKPKLFIATGTGVAPLRSMILDLYQHKDKRRATLIFGERTEAELLFRNEFEAIAEKYPEFNYIPILSKSTNGWAGKQGYVQDVMKNYIKDVKEIEVYVCGLKEMVDQVQQKLLKLGVPGANIFTERFV